MSAAGLQILQRFNTLVRSQNERKQINDHLKQWESVVLTVFYHMQTNLWAPPKQGRPQFLMLEDEELMMRKMYLENHSFYAQQQNPTSEKILQLIGASSSTSSTNDSSSPGAASVITQPQPPSASSAKSKKNKKKKNSSNSSSKMQEVFNQGINALEKEALRKQVYQPSTSSTVEQKQPSGQISIQISSIDRIQACHMTVRSLLSGSDRILSILLSLVICRSQGVGKDGRSIHRTLFPCQLPQAFDNQTMIPIPSFEWLAFPVLQRLRLWSFQHTRSRRKADCWPTPQQVEDLEALLAALVVCRLPEALTTKPVSTSNSMETASTSAPESYYVDVLHWLDDEKMLRDIEQWQPITIGKVAELLDPSKDLSKDPSAKLADEWVSSMGLSSTVMATIGIPFVDPRDERRQRNRRTNRLRRLPPGIVSLQNIQEDEEEEVDEKKSNKLSEKEAKKKQQEVQVDARSTDETGSELDKGRMWGTELKIEAFLAEVDCIYHAVLLQAYLHSVAGVVVKSKPVIYPNQLERLRSMMERLTALKSGDDSWNTQFRDVVFEHLLPLGARTMSQRATLRTGTNTFVSAYLEEARLNAQPLTIFQNEIGVRPAAMIDKMLDQHSKRQMLDQEHELHDIFVLFFFSYILDNETRNQFVTNRSISASFMSKYVLMPSQMEARGKELLLQSKRFGGMQRRPIVSFICKRWMVHDLLRVDEKDEKSVQRRMEREYDNKQPAGDAMETEFRYQRPMASSKVQAVGVWYDCEDSVEKALLLWLYLVKKNYKGQLEELIDVTNFCDSLGIE